jgi:hypothetical protein
MSWRHIRVVFILKSEKPLSQSKSLRPISLMSFILKTLDKLLDRHISGGALVEKNTSSEPVCLQGGYVYRKGSLPGVS